MKTLIKILTLFLIAFFSACSDDLGNDNIAPNNGMDNTSNDGINGSYSQIIVYGNFLYGLQNNLLTTLDISDKNKVHILHQDELAFDIESIFRYDRLLFIGSASSMHIFEIDEQGIPRSQSSTDYTFDDAGGNSAWCWMDPIIAEDTLAYVTLSTSRVIEQCRRQTIDQTNELRIFSIQDIEKPYQISSLSLANPKGLTKLDSVVYVCDDMAGLAVIDVSEPLNPNLINRLEGFTAYDAIVYRGILLVVGGDAYLQFDVSDPAHPVELSRINY